MVFNCREDHESFLHRLERVCASHGWHVHAWVLMGNHFHLLLETPEANLSSGKRVLLGGFGRGTAAIGCKLVLFQPIRG